MKKIPLLILLLGLGQANASDRILIVKDELPQMQLLADFLHKHGGVEVELTDQDKMPNSLAPYRSVILYLHRQMMEKTESAAIAYTRQGGRLIVLHHSISSGKRANRYWFDFLKISLPKEPLNQGGYAYRDPVTVQMVNLAPGHYITTHDLKWPEQTIYNSRPDPVPAATLHHTEAYLNHQFTDEGEKTVLCGFKYFDEESGRWYMQDRAAWLKKADRGLIFYFMFGHKNNDFENPLVLQIILNGANYQL